MTKDPDLKFKISGDSKGAIDAADKVKRSMRDLNAEAHKTGDGAVKMSRQIVAGLGHYTALVFGIKTGIDAITGATAKITQVTRQFDILNAGLQTATGGAENARVAFEAIQEFATSTPFDLQQVTDAFTKLVNFGLEPSERALTAYGNTAAAMGRSLGDMVEAVADATTGEFERLKGFGIKTSVEGDKIKFTFRGITTEIRKNAADIEKYLIDLSENNFGGNMAARMATLDGALSNLGDEWSKLYLNISQQGVGDLIEASVRSSIGTLEDLNAYLSSGVFEADLKVLTNNFVGFADDVAESMDILTRLIDQSFAQWRISGGSTAEYLTREFQAWLNNTRSFIKIITVEVASLLDRIATLSSGKYRSGAARDNDLKAIDEARRDSIAAIIDQHNAAGQKTDELINKTKQLREELAGLRDKPKDSADRLAGFRVGGGGDDAGGAATAKATAAAQNAAKQLQQQGESIIADLQRQVALYGETSTAAQYRYDLERGALAALDPAHKALIQHYADQVGALDRQQSQWDELVRSANELVDLREEIDQLSFDVIDERQFIAGIARIQDAFKNDLIDEAEMKAMFDRIGQSFNESFVVNAVDGVNEINQFAVQAARNIQDAFADFLFSPFEKGLDGMAEAFAKTMARMAANLAAQSALKALVGNLASGGGLGGIVGSFFHSGGVVGQGGISRNVPAMAFAGASRFHSGGLPGLKRDEVPAILQKGELVLSRNQVANMGSDSGGISITTNVSVSGGSGGAENARALGERINAQIRKVMVDEKRPGGLLA